MLGTITHNGQTYLSKAFYQGAIVDVSPVFDSTGIRFLYYQLVKGGQIVEAGDLAPIPAPPTPPELPALVNELPSELNPAQNPALNPPKK